MNSVDLVSVLLAVLSYAPLLRRTQGYFLAMISESQFYVLNHGESVTLECNFHADQYNLFDHPVLWRKEQLDEDLQINILGNINEPFVATNRFEVSLKNQGPRYQLELTISDVVQEDSGNYTCEVRGAHSIVIVHVMHHLFVRAPIESVTLSSEKVPLIGEKSPPIIRLVEGHPFSLRCTTKGGYPPPVTTVYIDKRDISAEFSINCSVEMSGVKGLRQITHRTDRWTNSYLPMAADDGARFKCVATVPGLSPYVEISQLDVDYSPKISCNPTEAHIGDVNVCIRCEIRAKPRASSVFWILANNGTTIMEGEVRDDYWVIVRDQKDGVKEAQLYMRHARPDYFRKYLIVAENSVAISRKEVELIQIHKSPAKQPLSDAASSHVSERVASRVTGQKTSKTTKIFSLQTVISAASGAICLNLTALSLLTSMLLTVALHSVSNGHILFYHFSVL